MNAKMNLPCYRLLVSHIGLWFPMRSGCGRMGAGELLRMPFPCFIPLKTDIYRSKHFAHPINETNWRKVNPLLRLFVSHTPVFSINRVCWYLISVKDVASTLFLDPPSVFVRLTCFFNSLQIEESSPRGSSKNTHQVALWSSHLAWRRRNLVEQTISVRLSGYRLYKFVGNL